MSEWLRESGKGQVWHQRREDPPAKWIASCGRRFRPDRTTVSAEKPPLDRIDRLCWPFDDLRESLGLPPLFGPAEDEGDPGLHRRE